MSSKYSDDLRAFVFQEHDAGKKARHIFEQVMVKWPDCGMRSSHSVRMMIGTRKQFMFSQGPRAEAAPITLAGPEWSWPEEAA
ncbi:MAG: hypothetical protein CL583_13400 [Alteromonadaceae bacterium]|nr:hypothetical protein [Alteromonadaceae bacterium]